MKHIVLNSWSNFERALRDALVAISYGEKVVVRNFELTTTDIDEADNPLREVDRLALVMTTGVDRDETSPFWDVPIRYRHKPNCSRVRFSP